MSSGTVLWQVFETRTPPASTLIGVSSLENRDFLIEIEVDRVIVYKLCEA
jgi:enamine deaminase RidA (YjgF/YER057c/UK114 family)